MYTCKIHLYFLIVIIKTVIVEVMCEGMCAVLLGWVQDEMKPTQPTSQGEQRCLPSPIVSDWHRRFLLPLSIQLVLYIHPTNLTFCTGFLYINSNKCQIYYILQHLQTQTKPKKNTSKHFIMKLAAKMYRSSYPPILQAPRQRSIF